MPWVSLASLQRKLATMTPEEHYQAVFRLGPWLVGCYLEIFLQGILCCQFSHYVSWYKGDKLAIRLSVAGLALLTTLKSIQSFALIWIQLILYFTDLEAALAINYTAWWQSANPLMVAAIGLYVQSYFCYRLYVISRSWFVVAPLAVIFLFAFLAICVGTYYITLGESHTIAVWFAAHLSSVFAGDVLLSLTTAYFLLRSKRNVLPQTVGLISALVRLTFQTAAPAAVCAMFNLIFSQIYAGDDKIISTAFNQMLPKLYAVSMMWTLNARRNIRAVHATGAGQSTSNDFTTHRTTRRTRGGAGEREDGSVALGTLGGIQVRTQMETVADVDVYHGGDAKNGLGVASDSFSNSTKDDYSMQKAGVV